MRKRAWTPFLMIAGLLAAAGCEDPPSGPGDVELRVGNPLLGAEPDVRLRAEAEAFAPGTEVTLVLENRSTEHVGYNLCFHALERRVGGDWIAEGEGRVCTAILLVLGPEETAEFETSLPADLAAGEYRYRVALHLVAREERRDQVSASFDVGG